MSIRKLRHSPFKSPVLHVVVPEASEVLIIHPIPRNLRFAQLCKSIRAGRKFIAGFQDRLEVDPIALGHDLDRLQTGSGSIARVRVQAVRLWASGSV